MSPILHLSVTEARGFHRRAVLLDQPLTEVGAALVHHGFVQIDPINICGRMHDLILRNRVAEYREGDLIRHLHGTSDCPLPAGARTGFEHHLPPSSGLAALTPDAWAHLPAAMPRPCRKVGSWSG